MVTKALFGLVFFCYITHIGAYKECQQTGQIVQVKVDNIVLKKDGGLVTLKRGTNATLAVTFKPSKNSNTATSSCYGVIGGVKVPFLVPKDGCKGMKPDCPLMAGKEYTFTDEIEVKTIYPSVTLVIEWQEKDDSGACMFCIELGAKII